MTNLRELASPLQAPMLRPVGPEVDRIQIGQPLAAKDIDAAAAFVAANPATWLRIYNGSSEDAVDLEFLAAFPGVRNLWLDLPPDTLIDLTILEILPPQLEGLYLPFTKRRIRGLDTLQRFTGLRRLAISGNVPGIEVVSKLTALEKLDLFRTKVATLDALAGLPRLRDVEVARSTVGDATALARAPALERLAFNEVRGLDDLAFVPRCASLSRLQFFFCKTDAALPSLAPLKALEQLRLTGSSPRARIEDLWAAPMLTHLLHEEDGGVLDAAALLALPRHATMKFAHFENLDEDECAAVGKRLGIRCFGTAGELPGFWP
ncbi:hypothetical protein BWI17_02900 [Betaproteobacteria bacterium GR16-43]|nr:hypothetical protein BWI17_02900 [Betaproteobacteria bacterium GR16-43]